MDSNKSNTYYSTSDQLLMDQRQHQQQQQSTTSSHMLQSHQHPHHHQISFGMTPSSSSSSSPIVPNFMNKEAGAYDLSELDQALFLYLDGQEPLSFQEQKQKVGTRPSTLSIFPSQPMHEEPSPPKAIPSTSASGSKRSSETSMELSDSKQRKIVASGPQPTDVVKREIDYKGPTSRFDQEGPKTPDAKTLRRLAQNREAARKSRLRKKAYIQQLESSRVKLIQVEQEIERVRAQGIHFGGSAHLGGDHGMQVPMGNISSGAAAFDMEYARWLEEHHRMMCELRNAVQKNLSENELGLLVDACLAHYDELLNLKSMIAKADVFHLVSGMWRTPAERCFMWVGGFRPSELIKIALGQIEPMTEQQLLGLCGLQQSTKEAEEVLTQGLDALNQSLSNTIVSDALSCGPKDVANYVGHMALAMNKLSTLEGYVRQADNLRHQTIHRLHQNLTTCQAARCLLGIAEYFHRLRALSSLWLTRPRLE